MKIIILLTILVSLTLFSCKDKISTPEEKPPIANVDYFPLKIGNEWSYKYGSFGGDAFSSDSSVGTIKWLITDYKAGVFTVKEVKTDTIKEITNVNYFNITQLDSTQIIIGYNSTIDAVYDTLIRYYNPTELEIVNVSRHRDYENFNCLLQLKKDVGIVKYSTYSMAQGAWTNYNVELISNFIN